MNRIAAFVYGLTTYGLFLATFSYAIGFVGNVVVPKSIDSGDASTPLGQALLINALLLGLFAIQHTIMARPEFKARWTRIVSPAVERSTFVLATVLVMGLMFWQWRPLPEVAWSAEQPILAALLIGLCGLGWLIVLLSTVAIGHFELFGLAQAWNHLRGKEPVRDCIRTPGLYSVVRHPLMLGFLVAFWATPHMTVGHLAFAAITTGYVLIGMKIEERDLVRAHGDDYLEYRKRVPGLIPRLRRSPAPAVEASA